MRILKRNGKEEVLSFDKILVRLRKLAYDFDPIEDIDVDIIAQKTIEQMYDGISSEEIDGLTANISHSMTVVDPGYNALASRIAVSNIHKKTPNTFHKATEILYKSGILDETYYKACCKYKKEISKIIDIKRDYNFDYFGIKTLERSYLLKKDSDIVERPQYMYMRVAVGLYPDDFDKIAKCYDSQSKKLFTHASPTLFNIGTLRQQCSSCYILSSGDSITEIFKTITDCAHISKYAGGIGVSISNIRSKGSRIASTNGYSDGVVPMIKVYNETARYVNQSSRRNGSFALYLEPHHADIFDFLDMKKNTGEVNLRARDLFYALWVSDLFMERVEEDGDWYLMCPHSCKDLDEAYGDEYRNLYLSYVEKGMYKEKIKARTLWNHILTLQTETGTPYMCYKDNVNKKSNQSHLGTVKSSNLCVAPHTRILTSEGYQRINTLENEEVEVWNGSSFTKTVVQKTGENQLLMRIKTNNGLYIDCTYYHKFYVVKDGKSEIVDAADLEVGMKLLKSEYPIIDGSLDDFEYAYERGYYHKEHKLKSIGHGLLQLKNLKQDLETIPINYKLSIKLRWLEGLCDRNAALNNINCLELHNIDKQYFRDIIYLFQTLGCNPVVVEGIMLICPNEIIKLKTIGFSPKILYGYKSNQIDIQYDITVVDIIYNKGFNDTYCFKEVEKGMGVFNGILTGQCAEITLYNTPDSTAVCNIGTISLNKFIKDGGEYDYESLGEIARMLVRNLNRVIDINFYPTKETELNNKSYRPIAIGVQGLYNLFVELGINFESDEAKVLNKKIFECIQYNCILESSNLAKEHGPYSAYKGSPISKGIFQHNMWGIDESTLGYDWEFLRKKVMEDGVYNSMLTALPPTASTSQILGNVESFEVMTSNMYTRRVSHGNYPIVNKYMVKALKELKKWTPEIRDKIIEDKGSIQNLDIPDKIKNLFKTTWEVSQKTTIDMSADRGPFIDHSQSLNIFMATPTVAKLSSMHFYGWKRGLKTGMYYLRSQPASDAEKFTINIDKDKEAADLVCSLDNKEECAACSG